jgi:hypothetical protein
MFTKCLCICTNDAVIYVSCSHESSFKQTQNFNNHSPEASRKYPRAARMPLVGQHEKNSARAYLFRFTLELGHPLIAARMSWKEPIADIYEPRISRSI